MRCLSGKAGWLTLAVSVSSIVPTGFGWSGSWGPKGPQHKNIKAAAVSPLDSLKQWVGAFGNGVYKSADGGFTWVNDRTGMTNLYVRSLLALNDTLLFAGTNDGVFRSTNGGNSWDSALATAHSVRALAHDLATNAVYAGTFGNGLYKSSNLGQSWTPIRVRDNTTNDSLIHQRAVAVFGRDSLYAGGSISDIDATGGSLFKSINGGLSWTQVQPGLAIRSSTMSIAISPNSPNLSLIIGTAAKGVHKSTNGGVNWQNINGVGSSNPLPDTQITAVAFGPDYRYCVVSTTGLVYRRALGDTTVGWLPAGGLPGVSAGVNALELFPQNQARFLGGTEGAGSYQSSDSGKAWSPHNTGLLGVAAQSLLFSQSHTLILGTDFGDQIWRSVDSAGSWTLSDSLDNFNSVRSLGQAPAAGAPIYAALYGTGVYKSVDDGRHWQLTDTVTLGNHFVRPLSVVANNPQAAYVGTGNGVWKTVNGGASWQAANNGIPFSTSVRSLALQPGNPNLILAGTDLDYLYRSTDGGINWTHITNANGLATGLPFIRSLTFDPSVPSIVYAGEDSGRIFRSTDAGATWSTRALLASPFSVRSIAADPHDRSVFFAATFGSGVFLSTDTAKTWGPLNLGLTDLEVFTLIADTARPLGLYAGTGNSGVFITKFAGNQPPVLAAIGPKSTNENQLLRFRVSGTDPDLTTPVLSAADLPLGAAFVDSSNGAASFSWTPTFFQAGSYLVKFIASDGSLADSELVTITVNNVNRPPVLATIGDKFVLAGQELAFNVSASDPDLTTPSLSVSSPNSLPPGAIFIDSLNGRGRFSWTPTLVQVGTHSLTFTASDGNLTDSELVTITVVDPAGARKGDLNLDGILTGADVVLMLNCVFLGVGSCPLSVADVNCDGILTGADVVLELNATFLGAPFPCP